jgi:hypothetical protein
MRAWYTTTRFFALVLVVCLAGAVGMVFALDKVRAYATAEEVLYFSSPKTLKRLSLGYHGLLADIYWTRVVQYFGRKHGQRAHRYDLLPALLDITVTLDPHLVVAYELGSMFLAPPPPEGAGMPDKAVEFAERGIRENPSEWKLYYHLGYVHALEREDHQAAAKAFLRGSEVPGAHPWMKIMAAAMAQHGGEAATARFLWQKILETTDDDMIRANARKRLRALRVDEEVRQLEAMVRVYHQRTGHMPASFHDFITAGWLRGMPRDPLGKPYRLMQDGQVQVDSPNDLPFIREGLPPGWEASLLGVPQSNK